jgi:hypothetical protein
MEEAYIQFHPDAYGIYIPADEILRRPKFQWFAVMPSEQLLKANVIVSKHLLDAISDKVDEYKLSTELRSVVAI